MGPWVSNPCRRGWHLRWHGLPGNSHLGTEEAWLQTHHRHQLYDLSLQDAFLPKSFMWLVSFLASNVNRTVVIMNTSSVWQMGVPVACILGTQELEAIATETETEWKAMKETHMKVAATSQTQTPSGSSDVFFLCPHPPTSAGSSVGRSGSLGDLLRAHSLPHPLDHQTSLLPGWENWGAPNKSPCFPKLGRSSPL